MGLKEKELLGGSFHLTPHVTQDGVKALGEEWALKLDRTERAFPMAGPQRALWPEPRRGRAAAEDKLWNQKPVNSFSPL